MCIKKSTLILLRLHLSLLKLFNYTVALSQVPPETMFTWKSALVFIIVHLVMYPALNAFNSYYDKDTGPIGGLNNPPPPTKQLLWVALALKCIGIIAAYFVNLPFMVYVASIMLLSVCYSHPSIRFKGIPVICTAMIGICYNYMGVVGMCLGIIDDGLEPFYNVRIQIVGLTLMMLGFGSTPLSQIFQLKEDAERGEKSCAILLGFNGTIIWAFVFFALAGLGSILVCLFYYPSDSYLTLFIALIICGLPATPFLLIWLIMFLKDKQRAFMQDSLMSVAKPGTLCVNLFIFVLIGYTYHYDLHLASMPEWQLKNL